MTNTPNTTAISPEFLSLEDRIAAAFLDDAESGAVATLIEETETAALRADVRADVYRKRALDPALVRSEVVGVRTEMEDASFHRDRLQAAVEKLRDRLRELRENEEDQRRRLEFEMVKAERDALASELSELYPPLVDQLGALLTRIAQNNRQVEIVNRSLPKGRGPLLVAELEARGLPMLRDASGEIPSIVLEARLPTFERTPLGPYAWPRGR